MEDINNDIVTTTTEVVHQEQQPNTTTGSSTEQSQTSSSDDKTVKNDDIDFSVVDALPSQLNKDTIKTETDDNDPILKSGEKGEKVAEVEDKDDSKKKDGGKSDTLSFSQLFRYASPVDKLFILLGRIPLTYLQLSIRS